MARRKIILGVTGSIAAYRSGDIARRLMDHGWVVTPVLTREATRFITPVTLSGLTGQPAYQDMFDLSSGSMLHIQLAEDADACLIAPATANVIAKLAHGFADDLLTCLVLGMQGPVWLAPAMNTRMYQHSLVQENCQQLRAAGMKFIEPVEGNLACGTQGSGHIAEVSDIVAAVCADFT